MRQLRTRDLDTRDLPATNVGRALGRRNRAAPAALAAAALAALLAAGAGRALATSDEPVAALRVGPVDVAPVAAPVADSVAAPGAEAAPACLRKIRVVYGGYGTPADGCAAR